MIELRDDLLFAEGGRRFCFVHPDDPGRCVKALSGNGDPVRRRSKAVWYKRLRPRGMFDDNLRELESFQWLENERWAEDCPLQKALRLLTHPGLPAFDEGYGGRSRPPLQWWGMG